MEQFCSAEVQVGLCLSDQFHFRKITVNGGETIQRQFNRNAVPNESNFAPNFINRPNGNKSQRLKQQIPFEFQFGTVLFGADGTILKRNLRGEEIGKAVAEALGK